MRDILAKSQGIDAWRDVSFSELKDGTLYLRGTAYFSDLSKLQLAGLTFLSFRTQRNSPNQLIITETSRDVYDNPLVPATRVPKIAEPLTSESLRRDRNRFHAGKPLLLAIIGPAREEITMRVPGAVIRASNFETNSPRQLRVHFTGERLVNAIEELISDDAHMLNTSTNTRAERNLAGRRALNERL